MTRDISSSTFFLFYSLSSFFTASTSFSCSIISLTADCEAEVCKVSHYVQVVEIGVDVLVDFFPLNAQICVTSLMNDPFHYRFEARPTIPTAIQTCHCGTIAPRRRVSRTWPLRRRGRPASPSFFITDLTNKSKFFKAQKINYLNSRKNELQLQIQSLKSATRLW